MSNYSYNYILEYIPSKYCGLSNKQQADRQAVYDFKDGHCPLTLKEQMLNKIRGIIGSNPSAWVVCFIPASTKAKQMMRYGNLSSYLNNQLACPVYIDGIDVAYDRESGHTSGKTGDPTANMVFNSSRFSGKKVILIDDVRTRGITFDRTADKLVAHGAASVYGVFVAQTIHPNLPIDTTPRRRGGYYDEVLNDILAEEQYQDEIANEIMEEELYQEQAEMDFLYEIGELY